MKQSKEIVDGRRKRIMEIIKKTGDARVPDIAAHLGVSEITVRRDLQYLEDHRQIDRYYGGARVRQDRQVRVRDELSVCREQIARYAASLVEDGDTIFINTSSTALQAVQYITARDVTVITNNGNIVTSSKNPSHITIILLGGELRNIKGTMVGEFALHNLAHVTATRAFIGCTGLSLENGMMTQFLNEVDINKNMVLRTSGTAYILADHTKLGKDSSFVSFGMDLITDVITDSRADPAVMDELKERGVGVHVAPESSRRG